MNLAEIEAFKRRVRDLSDRYDAVLIQIERDEALRQGVAADAIAGQGRQLALEAQVRQYLLDPLLEALGWELRVPDAILVEDTVAPEEGSDSHRRRLDYHGRISEAPRSLLAVEVKRPSIQLPKSKDKVVNEWIAWALGVIHSGEAAVIQRLPAAWRDVLTSAVDYVKRINAAYGDVPSTFVITNGEWFVVITDLSNVLFSVDPVGGSIFVFDGLADITARVEQFVALVGYRALSGYIPPQHPAALPDFVAAGQDAVCTRVVDVSYTRYGDRQPLISISVGAWVRTPKGAWILFQKTYPKQFLLLSDDHEELATRRSELDIRANDLLGELRRRRNVVFAPVNEFDRVNDPTRPVGKETGTAPGLRCELGRDLYRIVTLDQPLYFSDVTTHDGCPFHSWGSCSNEGNAVGTAPVTAPTSEPRSFFASGSPYHCAHVGIQTQRNKVCVLLPFEEHLCCRRCVFLSRCWPDTSKMPCREN